MQASPSVRAGSTESITFRFPPRQKESNIANTGGAKPNSSAIPFTLLILVVYRSKLLKNKSIELPSQISSAIANITEGFSFAYLQEAIVSALLSIVQTQKTSPAVAATPETSGSKSDDLDSNPVWQAISRQVRILRKEMKDSRKSVEDAGKNSVLGDPRSGSAASTGFGLAS